MSTSKIRRVTSHRGSFAVNELTDTTSGYSLGTLSSTDSDVGDTFTYSIVPGGDSGNFSIGGAGSDELILSDGVLDFETKSSYSVTVRTTDSTGRTYDETLTVNVNDINDEESLDTNAGLTLDEGAFGTITATELATSDVDNTAAQIVYTVDAATANGTLSLNWVPLTATDTFTQADIDAGLLRYRHDGGETTSDSFGFTVDDGAGTNTSATFNFAINPVNDAPVNMLTGQPQTIASSGIDGATDVDVGDLDGDGDVDMVATSWNDDRVTWFQNDGTGSFTEYTVDTGITGARHVFVADINGDTDLDLIVSDYEGDTVTWYENDGVATPTFTARVITNTADGAWSSFAIDMDGDGDIDVLSASIWDDKVAWYENDGAPTPGWTEHLISTNPDSVRNRRRWRLGRRWRHRCSVGLIRRRYNRMVRKRWSANTGLYTTHRDHRYAWCDVSRDC